MCRAEQLLRDALKERRLRGQALTSCSLSRKREREQEAQPREIRATALCAWMDSKFSTSTA